MFSLTVAEARFGLMVMLLLYALALMLVLIEQVRPLRKRERQYLDSLLEYHCKHKQTPPQVDGRLRLRFEYRKKLTSMSSK